MAGPDAWGAPDRSNLSWRRPGRASGLVGNARVIAAPAYRRLLTIEPILKRSIPTLIVMFLIVVALLRSLSLMAWRDDVERDAKAMLALAAGKLVNELMLAEPSGDDPRQRAEGLIDAARDGTIASHHVLAVTDRTFRIIASTPGGWEGKDLDGMISGGQPLFLFGERAGVMDVTIGAEKWYAALELTDGRSGAVAAMVPERLVFTEWRKAASLNVTLFVLTAGVLLIILYAYFSQAARAQAADGLYIDAHQRIDLALARGRCGLWDWDLNRGKMYWSRSMYDMLGYRPCDSMLSFGEVAEIIHEDDGDLFELANRIVSHDIDQIDQVFRMRHANGQWVWMRARAEVVDPDAPELQLIGIAVDISEQRRLAQRSEAADMRLRTAIENINESFVLWDAAQRLVMCNSKYQEDNGLADRDVMPGAERAELEEKMLAFASERRLANANGPNGGATYERQLADGRWLQVNELQDPRRRHRLGRLRHHPDQAASGKAGRKRAPPDGHDP